MGQVPQELKLRGKTENIWCENYINGYNHAINLFHMEHKELFFFLITGTE